MKEVSLRIRKERIRAARGEIPADLVLKGARVAHVFSGEISEADVAVHGGVIVGVGPGYQGIEELDLTGRFISPGLMDAHIHIESTMLLPSRLAAALIVHGTTAIVSDPHEIANVMGMRGIDRMIADSRDLPLDVFFMAPSCVPATSLETAGASIGERDLKRLKKEPRVLGLAEVMNFPGILAGDDAVLRKLALFSGRPMDGHAPGLLGKDLQAYAGAGIGSDHETTQFSEAAEKLRSGMMVMIREGSTAKNLRELLPLVTPLNAGRFCLVSDDLHPQDLMRHGHLEPVLRQAVSAGLDAVLALRMVSLNPAQHFGLAGKGAVAPGFQADLVVWSDLRRFEVERVYKNGRLVVREGRLLAPLTCTACSSVPQALSVPSLEPRSFQIKKQGKEARVIEVVPGQIVTKLLRERLPDAGTWVLSEPERDILKLAVVERHQGSGRIGLGLVRGFGLKQGALASSVAHDSHNIIAVGVSDRDLCRAVEVVRDMGGGMVAVARGRPIAKVPLEVGGLMTGRCLEELCFLTEDLAQAAASLGCTLQEPFMALSFLALPVIPELKLTDRGLVDVDRFELVSLFY